MVSGLHHRGLSRSAGARLHRSALRAAHFLRRMWWRFRRPRIAGCSLYLTNADGHLLLVKHSYGTGSWTLPSGGMAAGEDAIETSRREAREELGIELADPQLLATFAEDLHGARNAVSLVRAGIIGEVRIDGREIINHRFVPQDAIPDDVSHRIMPWIARARSIQSKSS